MALLLRFLVPVGLIVLLVWLFRRRSSGPVTGACASCRYRRKIFDDGTLCGFGSKETFKNPVHVKNCTDFDPAA